MPRTNWNTIKICNGLVGAIFGHFCNILRVFGILGAHFGGIWKNLGSAMEFFVIVEIYIPVNGQIMKI